jgi:hypothetical protein
LVAPVSASWLPYLANIRSLSGSLLIQATSLPAATAPATGGIFAIRSRRSGSHIFSMTGADRSPAWPASSVPFGGAGRARRRAGNGTAPRRLTVGLRKAARSLALSKWPLTHNAPPETLLESPRAIRYRRSTHCAQLPHLRSHIRRRASGLSDVSARAADSPRLSCSPCPCLPARLVQLFSRRRRRSG